MTLDPDTYQCPTHNIDITTLVREQLEDDDDARSAYWWGGRAAGRNPSGAREFAVIVSCPGAGAAHKLTCRGTLTP